MTIPAQSQPDKLNKTPLMIHRRNHSGELDVFEAAGYFSGYNEQESVFHNNTQKMMRRTSLDSPVIRNTTTNVTTTTLDQEKQKPLFSSPGSKIATFFNSLFNQNKKTKSSITKTQSFEEDGVGKRKRRSSINGYFRSSTIMTTTTSTDDQYHYSKSGFRTPPVTVAIASSYDVYTPTKTVTNHKHVVSSTLMLHNVNINNVDVIPLQYGNLLDEELKLHDIGKTELNRKWVDRHECAIKEKEYSCFNELDDDDDDGAESDSDLFELKNCDLLGTYSTALPLPVC